MKDENKKNDQLFAELTAMQKHIPDHEEMKFRCQFAESLVDTAQMIVLVLDVEGRIIRFNPYMEEISGYSFEEVRGKDWFSLFLPAEDHSKIREIFLKAVDNVKTEGTINPILIKDGSKLYIEWHDKTLKDNAGEVIGLLCIGQDVTERKKAKEELEKTNVLLQTILDGFPDGFMVINRDYTVAKLSNQQGSDSSSVYKKCYQISHNRELPCEDTEHPCPLPEVFKTGKSVIVEHIHSNQQMGEKVIEVVAVPVFDDQGKVVQVIEYCRDITERKQTENALKLERDNLIRIFGSIPDGVYIVNGEYDIEYINPIIKKEFGEIHDRKCYEYFHDRSSPCPWCKNPEVFAGKSVHWEWYSSKNDKYYDLYDTPFKNHDGTISKLEIFRDITEHKKSENTIQNIKKLKSIGTLAGGIAHDFNNILTGLFGNISLAKEKLSKDHPAFELLKKAEESMNRATGLTGQLLTFSKGGDPVKKNIRLGDVLKNIATFNLSGSKVKLVFEEADDLWSTEADMGQIQRAFSNIIINAKYAMPDGGRLYMTLKNIDISENSVLGVDKGKYIMITLRDEGAGIDPTHIERIFDPYFTTKQAGSGLGLSITRSIIEKHKGYIDIISKFGQGTTFVVYLPVMGLLEEKKIEQALTEPPTIENSAKILVMDDEMIIREIVSKMLQKGGFIVEAAIGGKQAIEMYTQSQDADKPFDLVILDITIPGGIGGKDAVREILKINPEAKCIVFSGYADDPIMANYSEYGFKGKISKPFTCDDLNDVVNQVLSEN